jgi:hypothetical protein
MSGTISENVLSRGFTVGRSGGGELLYDILGTDDYNEVLTLLQSTAPAGFAGFGRDTIQAEPIGVDETTGMGVWRGTVRYTGEESGDEYTFETGGGTTRVMQSLATVNRYPAPGMTAPDFQGAIGVSDDRIEGVDVTIPVFNFSETHHFDAALVTAAYKLTLFQLTGRWNQAPFKGLAAGECLFLGANGTRRGDGKWAIGFRFACQENVTDRTIGTITNVDKQGWDYLWVRYAQYEDTAAKSLVPRPAAVYVERVSQPGDFSLLGIGT